MTHKKIQLIALPVHADLDCLAAARCILLKNPDALIIQPLKMSQNALEIAKTQYWFKPVNLKSIEHEIISKVHLVKIFRPQHHKPIFNMICGIDIETIVYSKNKPSFTFSHSWYRYKSISLAACLYDCFKDNSAFVSSDKVLVCSAVHEKTWSGLNPSSTELDLKALSKSNLNKREIAQISSVISPGLRNDQITVYKKMLKSIEDIQVHSWVVTFISIKLDDALFDLWPMIDMILAETDAYLLVVNIFFNGRSRVFCKSRISCVDFFDVFSGYKINTKRNYTYFSFPSDSYQQSKKTILTAIKRKIRTGTTAVDIMSASPQAIQTKTTVNDALEKMIMFNQMFLVVNKHQKFITIITRRDLDRAVQMDLLNSEVEDWICAETPWVKPETPLRAIKIIMAQNNLNWIAVVDNNRICGVISAQNVLNAIEDDMPLPQNYLPLIKQTDCIDAEKVRDLLKETFSVAIFHLLRKIGLKAAKKNLRAYAVGGFARDLLLEHKNLDIDIVVTGDAIPFAEELSSELNADFKFFERFHTARLYLENLKIDFSSARIEHYSKAGALPQIEFSSLSNDLFRRDFTINTLAFSLAPDNFMQLKDFFGGHNDLKEKKIRVMHSFSFLEDPTRLYRAIRFASRFNFKLEKNTRKFFDLAVKRDAPAKLSKKRICSEIERCFAENKPHKIIKELFDAGLMKFLDSDFEDYSVLPANFKLVGVLLKRLKNIALNPDISAIYWTGLFCSISKERVGFLINSTGMPQTTRKKVLNAILAINQVPNLLSKTELSDSPKIYKVLCDLEIETLISIMVFNADKNINRKVLHFINNLRNIRCQVTGADLIRVGVKPGPIMSIIFEHLIDMKLDGRKLDKEEELKVALRLYKDSQS